MKKQREHTVVLVLALLIEVGLIVLFALRARIDTLQQYDWKHLAVAGAALFLLYILYVEVRIKRAGRTIVVRTFSDHDVDLYLRLDATPTPSLYDLRGYTGSGDETRVYTAPADGMLTIGVSGYAPVSSFVLQTSDD